MSAEILGISDLKSATERLILAAQRREHHMGDPISLISAKWDLETAAKHADAVIKALGD